MGVIGRKLRSLGEGRVAFMCPGCRELHQIRTRPAPSPSWDYNGNPDAPTFQPSVFVNPPGPYHNPAVPSCHSFVTDGRIQFLGDCTHALAGQTVDLPDLR
jgi:Family of unknown function (DUF6527)